MSIKYTHPEYDDMIDEWELVRACAYGQRKVKLLRTKVLPAPGARNGIYDNDRYKHYLERAIYTNVTGRTKKGLVGAAFRKAPTLELPPGLEYLEYNSDGAGQSLEQLAKDVLGNMLETGREALLVDYPSIDPETATAEDVALINAQATIKRYSAFDLDNWKTENVNGTNVLVMAKLREAIDTSNNEFKHGPATQYRVLRLRSDGYTQQIYKDDDHYSAEVYITKSDGSRWDFIPLFIIGSQNNDPSVDEIPLADIAHVNIGHFRNSADLEENSFIHGQLTLGVTSDMDFESWKTANPNGIVVGAQAGHFLGTTGGFHTAQADPNQIADVLQQRKEGQMLALGAKLVEQRNPNETAAAAKIDATGQNSVLSDLVTNVEEGIQRAIEWCGMFMGEYGEYIFELSRQFFDDSLDPNIVMAAIQGYDRTVIAKSDLQNIYRKAGVIESGRTNEDIDNETLTGNPLI